MTRRRGTLLWLLVWLAGALLPGCGHGGSTEHRTTPAPGGGYLGYVQHNSRLSFMILSRKLLLDNTDPAAIHLTYWHEKDHRRSQLFLSTPGSRYVEVARVPGKPNLVFVTVEGKVFAGPCPVSQDEFGEFINELNTTRTRIRGKKDVFGIAFRFIGRYRDRPWPTWVLEALDEWERTGEWSGSVAASDSGPPTRTSAGS